MCFTARLAWLKLRQMSFLNMAVWKSTNKLFIKIHLSLPTTREWLYARIPTSEFRSSFHLPDKARTQGFLFTSWNREAISGARANMHLTWYILFVVANPTDHFQIPGLSLPWAAFLLLVLTWCVAPRHLMSLKVRAFLLESTSLLEL